LYKEVKFITRIPVYEGEIDSIVGMFLAKSVLDFFVRGVMMKDLPLKLKAEISDP